MRHPNIKSYHNDFRHRLISPMRDQPQFLGRNAFDQRWEHEEPVVQIKGNLYEMKISLPGFKKEDIKVAISDDILSIRAEKKEEKKATKFILKEFDHDLFERTYVLNKGLGNEGVDAIYENGLLKVTFKDIPEDQERSRKKVEVQ